VVRVSLEVLVLGELQIRRDGREMTLPPSRKIRALLAYLALTARPHLRSRLCELLWQGPDDPRAALRWSLSRLRPLVDESGAARIVADRDRVGWEAHGASVDLAAVRSVAGSLETASTEDLLAAVTRFRGELLDGLDLDVGIAFDQWCAGQRDAARACRATLLEALVERLGPAPAEALPHARTWIEVAPLSGRANAAMVRLLGTLGRGREALAHYDALRDLLRGAGELRVPEEVEQARRALTGLTIGSPAVPAPDRAGPVPSSVVSNAVDAGPLLGRAELMEEVEAWLAADQGAAPVLLLTGEPGIGKTRLLDELAAGAVKRGMVVMALRAFEPERLRSYGPWIDLLRRARATARGAGAAPELALMLGDSEAAPGNAVDRTRLFGAVVAAVEELAGDRSVLVVLDDLQWLDEGSAALLHFVGRGGTGAALRVAGAARAGELADNPHALKAVRALERSAHLCSMVVPALDAAAVGALARSIAPGVAVARVVEASGGNPLLAIEVARALARGVDVLAGTVPALVADRLGRLGIEARSALPWLVALGPRADIGRLARLGGVSASQLLHGLEELEAHGVVRATEGQYEFVHELVRDAVYRQISGPRRRLLHRHIALDLASMPDSGSGAAELARHAVLGGEGALAARACLSAGERALRLFAADAATTFARRGLQLAIAVPEPERVSVRMALLRVEVLAAPSVWSRRSPGLAAEVAAAAREAQRLDRAADVASGFALLSILNEHQGDFSGARTHTLEAAAAVRGADAFAAARQLANSGRCLAHIELDMSVARRLIEEASSLSRTVALEFAEVRWGIGLLRRWDGDPEGALAEIDQAVALARAEGDRWRTCACLTWAAVIEVERGLPAAALARCRALAPVARRMEGGIEVEVWAALEALARCGLGQAPEEVGLDRALSRLRALDAGAPLAWALDAASATALVSGRHAQAEAWAAEALAVAERVGRGSEAAVARARLALACHAAGADAAARRHLGPALMALEDPDLLSAPARRAVAGAAQALAAAAGPASS
jgi:DNA-binding SARP family transcriptional activator/tetratricopeptide (TPR) repeat protein